MNIRSARCTGRRRSDGAHRHPLVQLARRRRDERARRACAEARQSRRAHRRGDTGKTRGRVASRRGGGRGDRISRGGNLPRRKADPRGQIRHRCDFPEQPAHRAGNVAGARPQAHRLRGPLASLAAHGCFCAGEKDAVERAWGTSGPSLPAPRGASRRERGCGVWLSGCRGEEARAGEARAHRNLRRGGVRPRETLAAGAVRRGRADVG